MYVRTCRVLNFKWQATEQCQSFMYQIYSFIKCHSVAVEDILIKCWENKKIIFFYYFLVSFCKRRSGKFLMKFICYFVTKVKTKTNTSITKQWKTISLPLWKGKHCQLSACGAVNSSTQKTKTIKWKTKMKTFKQVFISPHTYVRIYI